MSFSNFPPEVMQNIFQYLTVQDRLLLSRTCSAWHTQMFCPQFAKRIVQYLRSANDLEKPKARYCPNISIKWPTFENHEMESLIDYLNGASLVFFKISTGCPNAKRLVEALLDVVPKVIFFVLSVLGHSKHHSDDVICIRHPKLEDAILNGHSKYKIDCCNLTSLQSNQVDGDMIQSIRCLQGQLRVLKLHGHHCINCSPHDAAYNALAELYWCYLREFELISSPTADDLLRILRRMPYLQKLSLQGCPFQLTITGIEIEDVTTLSELSLKNYCVDTNPFNDYLTRSSLKKLTLERCTFTAEEELLRSGSITSFIFVPMIPNQLPIFSSLETLEVQGMNEGNFGQTLMQICENYPKLEHLKLEMETGDKGRKFKAYPSDGATVNPFPSLINLDELKYVYIKRLDLTGIDWTKCEGSKVHYIQLLSCNIDGTGAEQIVQAFKNLRSFYLDNCYLLQPRVDLFDIDGSQSNGLRRLVPHCKISYIHPIIEEQLRRAGTSSEAI